MKFSAYSRCVRITRNLEQLYTVDQAELQVAEEIQLAKSVSEIAMNLQNNTDINRFLQMFQPIIPTVNAFFNRYWSWMKTRRSEKIAWAYCSKLPHSPRPVLTYHSLKDFRN